LLGLGVDVDEPAAGATDVKRGTDAKRTLGTGSAGLAVGGAYLAVAAGVEKIRTDRLLR
jgi:hypothetical protein